MNCGTATGYAGVTDLTDGVRIMGSYGPLHATVKDSPTFEHFRMFEKPNNVLSLPSMQLSRRD